MRERLQSKPNEILARHILTPMLHDDSLHSFPYFNQVNEAHVIMLLQQELIDKQTAKKLGIAIKGLEQDGASGLVLDANYEDYYFNVEQHIIGAIGSDIGGRMHIARSRNDINATVTRMKARRGLLELCAVFNKMRTCLLQAASQNLQTIFAAYTHSQPAQPISFAHYLLALGKAFERDSARLKLAYQRQNMCPLGSGAVAGTSFPIDRLLTARLLGFEGVIENSIDAIAARDYLLETMAAYTIMASNVNRFAYDLYIWSANEHGYIEFHDSLSSCSSIMPQKKNPITLEHIKSRTAHLMGSCVDLHSCLRNIPYSHCRDIGSELTLSFWDSSNYLLQVIELLTESIKGLTVNAEKMEAAANQNFSTVTELANELVRQVELPFRTAHAVVGEIVQICVSTGKGVKGITVKTLNESLAKHGISPISWSQGYLDNLLDAKSVVAKQISLGGTNPTECRRMLDESTAILKSDEQWLADKEAVLESASQTREQMLAEVINWG